MSASMTAEPGRRFRAAEPERRRTYQKVRRESRWAGNEQWSALSRDQAKTMVLALRVYREKLRQPGQRWGAAGTISAGAVDLFQLLANIAVRGRGRLEPSVAWLAERLNVPGKVIHAWKAQLKEHGFLTWRRRYVECGLKGQRGPQVQQTSNAYALKLPAKAWDGISKLVRRRRAEEAPAAAPARLSAKEKRLRDRAAAERAQLRESLETLNVHVALGSAGNDRPDLEGT